MTTASFIASRILLVVACLVYLVCADPVKVDVNSPPEAGFATTPTLSPTFPNQPPTPSGVALPEASVTANQQSGCSNPYCTLCPNGATPLADNVIVTIDGVAENVSCQRADQLAKEGCVRENWCRPVQMSLAEQCECPGGSRGDGGGGGSDVFGWLLNWWNSFISIFQF